MKTTASAANPIAGEVITTASVTIPREYAIKVMVTAQESLWIRVGYHHAGVEVWGIEVPVVDGVLALDLGKQHFTVHDRLTVAISANWAAIVPGVVTASVDLE